VNKSDIRKKLLGLRKTKSSKNLRLNFKKILNILNKRKFTEKNVGGYYPYNHEVDVMEILHKFEKLNYKISLPRINKNFEMDFFYWSLKDPLKINRFGIPEPISNIRIFPNILLVPLVAFDKNFNRIGYGGGFYDRYIKKLKKKKNIITIGLAYSFQKVKEIPINKYDMKLDFVVTD
tara:strand:- start:125 stop:655 length:531 start_codon:yes stop_codon:yes gene_type:complete